MQHLCPINIFPAAEKSLLISKFGKNTQNSLHHSQLLFNAVHKKQNTTILTKVNVQSSTKKTVFYEINTT